ncbi:MAG: TRAP transporter small permease, partial [Dehalococcoidia bacterium]|nr:TRAP transporter small permease [Dehalococcoidia bacterium]
MEEIKSANKTEAAIHAVSNWLNIAGACILSILMFLTVVDVSLRYFFNHPLRGVFELTELMMVAIVVLGLGYTAATRGHISVDIIVDRFKGRSRQMIDFVNLMLGIVIFSLIVWQSALYAFSSLQTGEHSDILKVPAFYFKILVP